jgi:hypothetical protein
MSRNYTMRLLAIVFFVLAFSQTSAFAGLVRKVKPGHRQGQRGGGVDAYGGINADFSYKVSAGQTFKIVVWLDESGEPSDAVAKTVYMEQSDMIDYKPQMFSVKPGERKTIIAKVNKTHSGLVGINIWSDGYLEFNDYVNTGFLGKLQTQTDETTFERGASYAVNFNLVNQQNEAISLDAPVSLAVRASNADLSVDGRQWASELQLKLGAGSSSTYFRVKPTSITGRPISLATEMRLQTLSTLDESVVLADQHLTLPVQPAWWFLLGIAAVGGLLPAIYRVLRALAGGKSTTPWSRLVFQVLLGALAGMAAYALAGLDILGVRLDTSPPRTFFIMGFLFAYIGLDVLLDKFVGTKLNAADDQRATVPSSHETLIPENTTGEIP